MSQITKLVSSSGPGSGTVTSVSGGNNITITGVPTVNPTVNVSGTTNHAVQVGNALGALTSIPVGLTGEVLTGVTGADPIFAPLPAGGVTSITGNTGAAQTGAITLITDNSTPIFAGVAGTITLDFGLRNLFLGVNPPLTTGDENVAIGFDAGLSITSSIANVLVGFNAGTSLVDGDSNVAIGDNAFASATTGNTENVAVGANALSNLSTNSSDNTAVGFDSLVSLVNGSSNIAIGFDSGNAYNGSESANIVIGNSGQNSENGVIRIGSNGNQTACFIAGIDAVDLSTATVVTEASDQLGTTVLTAGSGITITPGVGTLTFAASGTAGVTTITGNTGAAQTGAITLITANSTPIFSGAAGTITLDFGLSNLLLGSSGSAINLATATTALGLGALSSVTDGSANTAMGSAALTSCDVGSGNSGFGFQPLATLTSGSNNTAIGTVCMNSLLSGSDNVAVGAALSALVTGSDNIALGNNAGAAYTGAESENIVIGSQGVIGESNTIRIGTTGGGGANQTSCYISGVDGVNVGSTAKVVTMGTAGTADQLGTAAITAGTGVTVTPGANTITISSAGTTNLTVTSVNNAASPYTVLGTDSFLAVNTSGGAVTIRLPNAPATGRVFYVKDSNGTAAASNITVTTVGGAVNIDGGTSFVMNTAYESINVVFDGSAYEVF